MAPKDTPDTAEAEVKRTPYEIIGGEAMVRRIVDRFYDIMDRAPEAAGIRAMHAKDLTPMRQTLAEFLCGWLGGPRTYFERPEAKCVMSAHRPFAIGENERDAWLACMSVAIEDCGVSEEMRELLDKAFARMAEGMRNRGPGRDRPAAGG